MINGEDFDPDVSPSGTPGEDRDSSVALDQSRNLDYSRVHLGQGKKIKDLTTFIKG